MESDAEVEDDDGMNILAKEQNPIAYEHDEQISDDEPVRIYLIRFSFKTYSKSM